MEFTRVTEGKVEGYLLVRYFNEREYQARKKTYPNYEDTLQKEAAKVILGAILVGEPCLRYCICMEAAVRHYTDYKDVELVEKETTGWRTTYHKASWFEYINLAEFPNPIDYDTIPPYPGGVQ